MLNIFSGGIISILETLLITVPSVLVALMGHELAHGWVSGKLGDPTPKMEGRMTFNPLAHLDPIGTLLMIFTGFGWAKPVRVNPMYYKDRKKGMALVALAGPLSNLLMAIIGVFLSALIFRFFGVFGFGRTVAGAFLTFSILNLNFMVFNLIPLPPLDGSRVLGMFLSNRTYYQMIQYEQYSMILLMLLSITGVFDRIIGTGVLFVLNGIIGMFSFI